jgi:hypothetical protein
MIFFFSLQVHLNLLLLSQLCISVLCFCYTLCSVCHVPSMHHYSYVHFRCYTLLLLHTSITLNNPELFSILCFYPHCASSASSLHNASPHFPCRVLCLIIISTLQLLWQLNPCIHHHWVLCRDSLAYPVVNTLCLLYHS